MITACFSLMFYWVCPLAILPVDFLETWILLHGVVPRTSDTTDRLIFFLWNEFLWCVICPYIGLEKIQQSCEDMALRRRSEWGKIEMLSLYWIDIINAQSLIPNLFIYKMQYLMAWCIYPTPTSYSFSEYSTNTQIQS